MTRTNLLAFAIVCSLAPGAFAQAPASASDPVGVWRGKSVCLVRASACKDEIVVYRITRVNAGDSLLVDARKIVNGQEEDMGVIGCRVATSSARITCTMPNGVWHFTVRGDSLVGELRLPDNTKFHDVRAARSLVTPGRGDAQDNAAVRRQLLLALTPPLLAGVDSLRKLRPPGKAREVAWLVRAKGVGPQAEARFRGAVLRVSGGREFTSRDSTATVVSVESVRFSGDSADVLVDRSERWCRGGGSLITGAVYSYRFVRGSAGWRFLNQSVYDYYEPPPPPPPGTPSHGCAHLFDL